MKWRTVAECVDQPLHAGSLDGAQRVGEAAADGRIVRIGIWTHAGRTRARFRSTTCASLIAYADCACAALEGGAAPESLDTAALQAVVRGVHPVHLERAALVAAAIRAAFAKEQA